MSARKLKTAAKAAWHGVFRAMQRAGINVLPRHFYSAIPDLAELERRSDWRRPRSLHGIALQDVAEQLTLLGQWLVPQQDFLRGRTVHEAAIAGGGSDSGYGEIEADVLFGFVATCRPKRVVQVGCGVSTAVMLSAAEHAAYRPDVICIEPFPSVYLKDAEKRGALRLLAEPAQSVGLETMTSLGEGDLLFVDSTHAVKPGSEVNFLIHEVLPRLSAGTWVHFHDVYFPYDYARDTLSGDLWFPQETALLYAFLTGNTGYRLEASLSMIHYGDPEGLRRLLPRYRPGAQTDGLGVRGDGGHFPSAIYLRVVDRRIAP